MQVGCTQKEKRRQPHELGANPARNTATSTNNRNPPHNPERRRTPSTIGARGKPAIRARCCPRAPKHAERVRRAGSPGATGAGGELRELATGAVDAAGRLVPWRRLPLAMFHPRPTTTGAALALAACTVLACRSAPEPPPPLVGYASAQHRGGSLLGGPLSAALAAAPSDPAQTFAVRVVFLAARAQDVSEWPFASASARVIARDGGDRALGAAAQLTRGTRLLAGEDARDWLEAHGAAPFEAELYGALAAGRSAHFEARAHLGGAAQLRPQPRLDTPLGIEAPLETPAPRAPAETSKSAHDGGAAGSEIGGAGARANPRADASGSAGFALELHRRLGDDTVELGMAVRPGDGDREMLGERVVFDVALEVSATVLVAWPQPNARVLVAAVWLEPPPQESQDPEGYARHVERVALADAQALERAEEVLSSGRAVGPEEGRLLQFAHAFAAAGSGAPAERRSALVFITGTGGSPLAADVALVGDDTRLDDLVLALADETADGAPDAATENRIPRLVWRLERRAWLALAQDARAARIQPAEQALLLRHAGEVGRAPGRLAEIADASKSFDEMFAALVAENRIFLADSSPAARSRAHAWLTARGLGVANFDPLSDVRTRQAALAGELQTPTKMDPR